MNKDPFREILKKGDLYQATISKTLYTDMLSVSLLGSLGNTIITVTACWHPASPKEQLLNSWH